MKLFRHFEVTFQTGRWQLIAHGASLGSYDTKDTAIAEATRVAAANQPCRLIIRRENGSTELERVFEATIDPAFRSPPFRSRLHTRPEL
jgi:hypothetical protein